MARKERTTWVYARTRNDTTRYYGDFRSIGKADPKGILSVPVFAPIPIRNHFPDVQLIRIPQKPGKEKDPLVVFPNRKGCTVVVQNCLRDQFPNRWIQGDQQAVFSDDLNTQSGMIYGFPI